MAAPRAVLGTNPISFSIPNPAGTPVTLDFATSSIAAGKIKAAKAKHERLPPDAILDAHGRPSTDPQAFFDGGFLLPFGGHKGYALAVIAELLSGPLAGADAYPGVTSRSGIFIFAVDAAVFRPSADYEKALAKTLGRIKAVPPAPGFEEVLLPGEPEARARARRERDGIPIPDDTWRAVCEVGAELGVNVETSFRERGGNRPRGRPRRFDAKEITMRLLTFAPQGQDGVPRLGALVDDDIVDLAALDEAWRQENPGVEPLPTTMRGLLAAGEAGLARVRTLLEYAAHHERRLRERMDIQTIGDPVLSAGDRCGEVPLRGQELPSAPGGAPAKRSPPRNTAGADLLRQVQLLPFRS